MTQTINPVIICDLDGTLALVDNRRKQADIALKLAVTDAGYNSFSDVPDELKREVNSHWWNTWEDPRNIMLDEPHLGLVQTLRLLQDHYYLWIFSARNDRCKDATVEWLDLHKVPYHELIMRPNGYNIPDNELKEKWLDEHILKYNLEIAMIYDDRQQVVNMWKERGYEDRLWQVAVFDG